MALPGDIASSATLLRPTSAVWLNASPSRMLGPWNAISRRPRLTCQWMHRSSTASAGRKPHGKTTTDATSETPIATRLACSGAGAAGRPGTDQTMKIISDFAPNRALEGEGDHARFNIRRGLSTEWHV